MDKYITYNTTTELHRELTNILLLSIEEDSYFYCYCGEENGECGICSLAIFLVDVHHQNKIEGLSPRKFLARNHNNKEKLELFASKIVCFFDKIEKENKISLEFFQRNYSWSLKVYSTGETLTVKTYRILLTMKFYEQKMTLMTTITVFILNFSIFFINKTLLLRHDYDNGNIISF